MADPKSGENATPTPMIDERGGFIGGVPSEAPSRPPPAVYGPTLHRNQPPGFPFTDPYWLRAQMPLVCEEDPDDEWGTGEAEDPLEASTFVDSSPIYFPWQMAGETWEAACASVENEMKKDGGWTLSDDETNSEEISQKKSW